ncbi:MAG TPA: DUF2007 domain-containing protein [Acidobacteriaceae bacterium]
MSDGVREFADRYAAMSETELIELARSYDSLVEPAQDALRAEFDRRHLEPPVIQPVELFDAVPRDLMTIARYRDLPEADLARGLLESAGITAWIQDDNLVRMDWFYSNAVGGVRLQVDAVHADAAREILDQPMPAEFALDGGEEFAQPRCPKCGSEEVRFESPRRGAALVALYALSVPLPPGSPSWHCGACGTRWQQAAEGGA